MAWRQAMISVDPANDLLLDEMPRLQLTASRVDDIALFVHNEADFAKADVRPEPEPEPEPVPEPEP